MNKYSLGKQETLAELCEKKDKQINELASEFQDFVTQYGCDCGHPHCTRCQDTFDANLILSNTEEYR